MKYAIIRLQGHQYKVQEGEELLVDKIKTKMVSPEVLLVKNDKKVEIGKPVVKGAKLKVKVLGAEKGEKITVKKFRAKSRYRKKIGFRPQLTRLLVKKID